MKRGSFRNSDEPKAKRLKSATQGPGDLTESQIQTESHPKPTLETLPSEILREIFEYTSVNDHRNLRLTSRHLNQIITDEAQGPVLPGYSRILNLFDVKKFPLKPMSQFQFVENSNEFLDETLKKQFEEIKQIATHIKFYCEKISEELASRIKTIQGPADSLTKYLATEQLLDQINTILIGEIDLRDTSLDLSNRKLTRLPRHIFSTPESKAYWEALTEIDLDHNYLTSIPSELCRLENLQTLRVAENKLKNIPDEISQLRALINLILFGNQLTTLPATIGSMENLERLLISGNNLTRIPAEFAKLKRLEQVDLSWNQLIESPMVLTQCNLQARGELLLCGNQLEEIPVELMRYVKDDGSSLSSSWYKLYTFISQEIILPFTVTMISNHLCTIASFKENAFHLTLETALTEYYRVSQLLNYHPALKSKPIYEHIFSDVIKMLQTDQFNELRFLESLTNEKLINDDEFAETTLIKYLKRELLISERNASLIRSKIDINSSRLDLSNSNITFFPASLLQDESLSEYWENLQELNLANNYLRLLPPNFKKLKSLESLNLKNNNLFIMPDELGYFIGLVILSVENNFLTEIPPTLSAHFGEQWAEFSLSNQKSQIVDQPQHKMAPM